jgi:hypothetical protein
VRVAGLPQRLTDRLWPFANGQNRPREHPNDAFGDATEQYQRPSGAADRADDNEVETLSRANDTMRSRGSPCSIRWVIGTEWKFCLTAVQDNEAADPNTLEHATMNAFALAV